jgi:hypothetical protein
MAGMPRGEWQEDGPSSVVPARAQLNMCLLCSHRLPCGMMRGDRVSATESGRIRRMRAAVGLGCPPREEGRGRRDDREGMVRGGCESPVMEAEVQGGAPCVCKLHAHALLRAPLRGAAHLMEAEERPATIACSQRTLKGAQRMLEGGIGAAIEAATKLGDASYSFFYYSFVF